MSSGPRGRCSSGLEAAGLIVAASRAKTGTAYVPARPLDRISVSDVLQALRGHRRRQRTRALSDRRVRHGIDEAVNAVLDAAGCGADRPSASPRTLADLLTSRRRGESERRGVGESFMMADSAHLSRSQRHDATAPGGRGSHDTGASRRIRQSVEHPRRGRDRPDARRRGAGIRRGLPGHASWAGSVHGRGHRGEQHRAPRFARPRRSRERAGRYW